MRPHDAGRRRAETLVVLLGVWCAVASAEVRLPALISDHMVSQQNAPVHISLPHLYPGINLLVLVNAIGGDLKWIVATFCSA